MSSPYYVIIIVLSLLYLSRRRGEVTDPLAVANLPYGWYSLYFFDIDFGDIYIYIFLFKAPFHVVNIAFPSSQ